MEFYFVYIRYSKFLYLTKKILNNFEWLNSAFKYKGFFKKKMQGKYLLRKFAKHIDIDSVQDYTACHMQTDLPIAPSVFNKKWRNGMFYENTNTCLDLKF